MKQSSVDPLEICSSSLNPLAIHDMTLHVLYCIIKFIILISSICPLEKFGLSVHFSAR